MQCPRCEKAELDVTLTGMLCPACGYDLFADDDHIPGNEPGWDPVTFNAAYRERIIKPLPPRPEPPEPAPAAPESGTPDTDVIPIDLPLTIYRQYVPGLDDRERARFEGRCLDAVAALNEGDRTRAREILRATLEITELSDQVWLFLAGLALTRAEQQHALEQAVACSPDNLVAVGALALLRGDLDAPDGLSRRRLGAGEAEQDQLTCPNCGGQLAFEPGAQQVVCHHCGHTILDVATLARGDGPGALQIGLLRRKQNPRAWNIGQRWVRCDGCGATTTLSRHTLSNTCRFCGSQNVVAESTDHRFEQPDFIVPFKVDQAAALAAVEHHLKSGLRMITRLFADAVARIELNGVYLPFWVFDAEMSVSWSWTNAPDHGQYPVLLGDVLWFGAETLPRKLLEKMEPYDLSADKDYDPRLLAVFPAELYATDVVRASLDVRPRLVALAERKASPSLMARKPSGGYGQWGDSNDSPGRLVMNATTQYMSYRFGLLPVWIGQLVEEDGDTQPVVVNGQTGKVALGKQS